MNGLSTLREEIHSSGRPDSDWDDILRSRRAEQKAFAGRDESGRRMLMAMWPDVGAIRSWAAFLGMSREGVEAILTICRERTRMRQLNRRLSGSRARSKRSSPTR